MLIAAIGFSSVSVEVVRLLADLPAPFQLQYLKLERTQKRANRPMVVSIIIQC